jgi:hypothetical protein
MTLLEQLDAIAPDDIPAALLRLTARMVAIMREEKGPPAAPSRADGPIDQQPMLTAKEVATRLNTSVRWVYEHRSLLGGKQISARCVRFSPVEVGRALERRRPSTSRGAS